MDETLKEEDESQQEHLLGSSSQPNNTDTVVILPTPDPHPPTYHSLRNPSIDSHDEDPNFHHHHHHQIGGTLCRSPTGSTSIITPNHMMLTTPSINFEAATAPNSPTGSMNQNLNNMKGFGGSAHQLGARSRSGSRSGSRSAVMTPTGSLLTVNKSGPLELRESMLSVMYPGGNFPDDGDEVSLMYSKHERIPMKDFAAEIRASIDVENFLHQAQLMLDVAETNLEAILDKMLHHLLDKEEPQTSTEEAMKAMFTHDNVHHVSRTIQGTCCSYGAGFDFDQSWMCMLCTLPSVQKRHVAIARLKHPANLGRNCQEVYFIILVVAPTKEKGTKNALETGRTFSTLFADIDLRLRLLTTNSQEEFKLILWEHTKELADEQSNPEQKKEKQKKQQEEEDVVTKVPTPEILKPITPPELIEIKKEKDCCWFGAGLKSDFMRRLRFYKSDFVDGVVGPRTIRKTLSTTAFLYFACILPCIALGVLNSNNTDGKIDVQKVIYSQTIGGLFFALFGGQPMVILLTTAPLALYTKVIYTISKDLNEDFFAMFACVGLFNSFFLIVFSLVGASKLMKWSTRSTEEIFALFISIAFTVDATKDIVHDFEKNYLSDACIAEKESRGASPSNVSLLSVVSENVSSCIQSTIVAAGVTSAPIVSDSLTSLTEDCLNATGVAEEGERCLRENSILFLLLVLGTVWVGLSLFNFTKTPFLNAGKRELLADYALPVSVIVMSFFGSYVFQDIELKKFAYNDGQVFTAAPLQGMSWQGILISLALGFCLSLLFFMDQNISGAMVDSPDHKLKKGPAYHWDLLVVAILNGFLTYFGLPMMHGALPHSPLHVRAMADMEDRVDQGHISQRIMHARETRITSLVSHILIGLSLFLLPSPMNFIPPAVLNGLFLYLAITALNNNQMYERITLLFTEQASYPPNHYIRSVPQRKIHLFTLFQIIQLGVMCAFGFSPIAYMKMVFPVLILLLLPIRHKLVSLAIEKKYLNAIDGH